MIDLTISTSQTHRKCLEKQGPLIEAAQKVIIVSSDSEEDIPHKKIKTKVGAVVKMETILGQCSAEEVMIT